MFGPAAGLAVRLRRRGGRGEQKIHRLRNCWLKRGQREISIAAAAPGHLESARATTLSLCASSGHGEFEGMATASDLQSGRARAFSYVRNSSTDGDCDEEMVFSGRLDGSACYGRR